jgi:iron(III) transport system permease protein
MDYSVPSLFGVNVYALEIFAEFSASNQPVRAFLLSTPLLVLAAGGLFAGQALLRHAAQVPVWGVSPWSTPPRWQNGFALCQKIAVALWGAQALIPLIVLVKLTLGGEGWMAALQPAVHEFGFSFGVAAATALLSLPLGWSAMELLTHQAQRSMRAGWLLFLPVALPAPLVGIGLVALWNRPYFDGVYATAWMPVLAALARFAPLAALVLLAQSQRLDPLLWDAARVFQARDRQTTWHVRLPLLLPGLLAGASLVFALTLGELGATLIVAPPGQSTLTLRIYNYLHYGASDVVAGLCLAMLLFTLAAGGLGALSLAAQSRHTSMPEHP